MIELVLGRNRRRRGRAVARLLGAQDAPRYGVVVADVAARDDRLRRFASLRPLLPDVRVATDDWADLSRYPIVLVDTVLDDDGIRRLFALDDEGVRIIVLLDSGRGRDGAEVDALFGMADEAGPRSLVRAARFRRALFDRAVGQGSGLVLLAGDTGVAEAGAPGAPIDAPDVADAAWDGAEAAEGVPPRFLVVPDEECEAHAIAGLVEAAVASGVAPEACVVGHVSPDKALGALIEAFDDRGLALDLPSGQALAREPFIAVARAAFRAGSPVDLAAPCRTARALAARLACVRVLDSVPPGDVAAFDAAIAAERFWLPRQGGVRLVPFAALAEVPARCVVIGGLVRGAAGSTRARFVAGAVIRNAETCAFVSARTVQDRATAAHPVVEELLDVRCAGGQLRDRVEHLDRTAALRGSRVAAWRLGRDVPAALVGRRAARSAASRAADLGPWDGVSDRSEPVEQPIGVTALESWLVCPARYGFLEVLGVGRRADAAPDVSPAQRGSVVHTIVERFARDVLMGPRPDPDAAAQALHALAVEVLETLDGSPAWAAAERDRWLAGLLDDAPKGLLAAWLASELGSDRRVDAVEVPFELALPGGVRVRGRIDRVDAIRASGGGRLVIDYKSGRPPSVRRVARGLAVQPLAYAAAVARGVEPVATAFLPLVDPASIDLVGFTGDDALIARIARPRAARLPLDPADRDALLAYVAQGVVRLRAGVFHPTLAEPEEAGCSSCPVARICRRDGVRAALMRHGDDARAQRPLPGGP